MIAKLLPQKTVYAFDSFRGLHDVDLKVDQMKNGAFGDADEREVRKLLSRRKNVVLTTGIFPESAGVVEGKQFSIVHCDVDTYESTHDVLYFFWPRVVSGGVIVVDDYGHPHTMGCRKAVDEFCDDEGVTPHFYGTIQCFLRKP